MQGRYKPKGAPILASMLAGMSPKEAAITHGAYRCYANKVAKAAGLSALYVTEDERRAVLTGRAGLTRR